MTKESSTVVRELIRALALSVPVAVANATIVPEDVVQLSTTDKAAIVSAACGSGNLQAAESVDAYRFTDHVDVAVVCRPQGAVRAHARCDNSTGRWTCEDRLEYIEVRAGALSAHVAPISSTNAEILRYLLGITSFDGRNISSMLNGTTCYIPPVEDDGYWRVACESVRINVAQDCVNDQCVYRAFGWLGEGPIE